MKTKITEWLTWPEYSSLIVSSGGDMLNFMYGEDLNAGELAKIDIYVSENEAIPDSSQKIDISNGSLTLGSPSDDELILEVAEPTLFLDYEKFDRYRSRITIYSGRIQNVKLMKEFFTFISSSASVNLFNRFEKVAEFRTMDIDFEDGLGVCSLVIDYAGGNIASNVYAHQYRLEGSFGIFDNKVIESCGEVTVTEPND